MSQNVTAEELIERAKKLAPVLLERAEKAEELRRIPDETINDLHELDIDDLLGRDTVPPNALLLGKNIHNKVVLVTGAGGSIGSELCRQIIKKGPDKLLLLELSEFALYSLHHELVSQVASAEPHAIQILPLLASVRDEARMREIRDLLPITAPPKASPWPFMNLVNEWITRSMPWVKGWVRTGVARVLSTEVSTPAALAISARAVRSVNRSKGLQGLSAWISLVLGRRAALRAVRFERLTGVTSMPKPGRMRVASSCAPA